MGKYVSRKKKITIILLTLSLIMIIINGNGVVLAATGDDAYEPNNSESQATIFVPNETLNDLTITSNDEDWYCANLGMGKYTMSINTSDDAVNPDVKIYVNEILVKTLVDNGGSPIPAPYHFQVSQVSQKYCFDIYGHDPSVDYSSRGTYQFSISYTPIYNGVEDTLEPNNTKEDATVMGYSDSKTDLTFYSYQVSPDVDWFAIPISKEMDFSCRTVSNNSLLNPKISKILLRRPDGTYVQASKVYKVEVYHNYNGMDDFFNIHNTRGINGEKIYVKIELADPSIAPSVGYIKYALRCSGGIYSPWPTPTPTPTPNYWWNGGSSGGTSGGSGIYYQSTPTPTPTPTPTEPPNQIPLDIILKSIEKPTISLNNNEGEILLSQYSFCLYYDLNQNHLYDGESEEIKTRLYVYKEGDSIKDARTYDISCFTFTESGNDIFYVYIPETASYIKLEPNKKTYIAIKTFTVPAAIP